MGKTADLIEKKVKAFATNMETRMTTKRAARVKEVDKKLAADAKKGGGAAGAAAKKGEDLVMKLTFSMSKAAVTKGRNGKEQAAGVAKGVSWTCAGSHMNDSARHINMYTHGPGKKGKKYMIDPKNAFGTNDENICTFKAFQTEWVAEMKKQGLRNYKTGTTYGDGDDYHLELPDSRIPKTDPECVACVDEYCRLVIMEGKKHNTKFEKPWASEIKAPMEKYKKQKAAIENAARIIELKAMRFSGKITKSGKLFSKESANKKASLVIPGSILPTADIIKEAGKLTVTPMPLVGVAKSKTWTDVSVTTILTLVFLKYEHLEQTFLKSVQLDAVLVLKGLLSYGATASASAAVNIALGSGLDPTGSVIIDYSVDGLGSDDHSGAITYDIKGLKSRFSKAT